MIRRKKKNFGRSAKGVEVSNVVNFGIITREIARRRNRNLKIIRARRDENTSNAIVAFTKLANALTNFQISLIAIWHGFFTNNFSSYFLSRRPPYRTWNGNRPTDWRPVTFRVVVLLHIPKNISHTKRN